MQRRRGPQRRLGGGVLQLEQLHEPLDVAQRAAPQLEVAARVGTARDAAGTFTAELVSVLPRIEEISDEDLAAMLKALRWSPDDLDPALPVRAAYAGAWHPVLAASSDGVGPKLAIAQAMDKHDTVGLDLVARVVDDLVVCGAEPLFLQDYIAVGRTVPERIGAIVAGIAEGCVQAGCALLGGETAEHPGLMEPDHYDISATGVGVVEADEVLGPDRVKPGDVLIAMGSSGLHSNGYSLARAVLLDIDRGNLAGYIEEFGRTLGEELLEPTRIYAKDCLALAAETQVRTFCHVTGGGLAGNLERVVPHGLVAELDRGTWTPAPVFAMIAQRGRISRTEMDKTFNMGVGMVAVVAPEDVDRALAILTARHLHCWVLGTVNKAGKGATRAKLVGQHPRF